MKKHQLQRALLVDNYDSFTYNLQVELVRAGLQVDIFRNDVSYEVIEKACHGDDVLLVFSPGPGRPADAGHLLKIITQFAGKKPMLGVCLGHQAIIESFGGKIIHASEVVHGKSRPIHIRPHPVFDKLHNPLQVARYHSLCAKDAPAPLQVIARHQDEVMAIASDKLALVGFQFHPESIMTRAGSQLMRNSISFINSNLHHLESM